MLIVSVSFNRTRRNWNVYCFVLTVFAFSLLIVPEGIEILPHVLPDLAPLSFNRTRRNWNFWPAITHYVNLPFNRTRRNWNSLPSHPLHQSTLLLIVPEGIEMYLNIRDGILNQTFNRTRRNWNFATLHKCAWQGFLLIVPEGIEMRSPAGVFATRHNF